MKGINKLVMEIKPDDEYFEKALLFLKPACIEKPQHEISNGADNLLNRIKEDKQKKKKCSFKTTFLSFIFGAGITLLIMFAARFFF